ncbi:GGDEF domain-containing protein [Colwellia psychrerythraea]|uniref:diguanylate cyclase n=1 Tax=Colwellia psychrerythraea TaxID=28229 RepID=A0A099KRP1_COLPS|nr:GGDEF domain-containing protein [Colwellia psychrerythraea]KGJ92890.1 diguanylate cyclase [Colwellia psychrerythraea]
MQTVSGAQTNKELYFAITLAFFTLIILALLFLNIEKTKVINLNSADIKVVDDSTVFGTSAGSVVKTNQGLDFSCQINKSHLAQPFCELLINVQDLSTQATFTGLDLSNFEKIGLWITHNHPTQPGTRVELRNFNQGYAVKADEQSLKPNSFEYLEAYVTNPVWLKLSDFSIPQGWSNKHNLALNHGGTDYSNIYTIVIAPSSSVAEGSYKLTIERIEIKGKYISTSTLVSVLIMLWSIALGYVIRRVSPAKQIKVEPPIQAKKTLVFGAMSCPVTGALNRIGLRKCFDQLAPTDLHNLSVIFLNIDYFEVLHPKHGQQITEKILQQFVSEINDTCRSSDTVARWNTEEFLLVCPDTTLAQAVDVADKIRKSIQEAGWPNDIKITCSSGVAQMHEEDLNDLIARANKALYKAKNSGNNRTAAA